MRKAFEEVRVCALEDKQGIYWQKEEESRLRVRLWGPEVSYCLVGPRCFP